MGEFADMEIDAMMDDPDACWYAPPAFVACKFCKTPNLQWGNDDGRWRLYNDKSEPHSCKEFRIRRNPLSEFRPVKPPLEVHDTYLGTNEPTTDLDAHELMRRGYFKVSNKYGVVARVDRPDWLEVMAEKSGRGMSVAEFYEWGTNRVSAHWCDHYRRVYSKDTLTVDLPVLRRMRSSTGEAVGYVEL